MWSQELIDNRNRVLDRIEWIKRVPLRPGSYLHLGCGPQIYDGWTNIDKYHDDPRVVRSDMFQLPFESESIDAIYSSHALEHLPFRRARAALVEWSRVLKPEARLYLAVPDLEEICRLLLAPDSAVSSDLKWGWFVYTLFGWQQSASDRSNSAETEPDPGQFHHCGFTERSLRRFLTEAGFEIHELYRYDGWDTPSLWCEATKMV